VVLIGLIAFMMTFLTELTSNVATINIILPILATLSVSIHKNPLLLMIPATLTASHAFMLPIATPPNAVAFASGKIKIIEMAKLGFFLNLFGVVMNTCWIFILGPTVFDISLNQMPYWANITITQ